MITILYFILRYSLVKSMVLGKWFYDIAGNNTHWRIGEVP